MFYGTNGERKNYQRPCTIDSRSFLNWTKRRLSILFLFNVACCVWGYILWPSVFHFFQVEESFEKLLSIWRNLDTQNSTNLRILTYFDTFKNFETGRISYFAKHIKLKTEVLGLKMFCDYFHHIFAKFCDYENSD